MLNLDFRNEEMGVQSKASTVQQRSVLQSIAPTLLPQQRTFYDTLPGLVVFARARKGTL